MAKEPKGAWSNLVVKTQGSCSETDPMARLAQVLATVKKKKKKNPGSSPEGWVVFVFDKVGGIQYI